MGEFHRWHPGPERLARSDLANDLRRGQCETGPPLGPRSFAEVELVRADRGGVWHNHGRDVAADRGAVIRRIGDASTLLAATGFTMTDAGTLSLGGAWGHEATISVLVDDYIVPLHATGAAGMADAWRIWSEEHWAEQRAGRPARQPGGAAAGELTLKGVALPHAVLPGTPHGAHASADQRGKQGAEEAAPALALPANDRGPMEKGVHAALQPHQDAGHGGGE